MNLAPSASQRGYAMAALLVAMAVMSILLSVAMPTWNQMIRREKEEELIFRGNQYARAINFYQRKFANASPANLDILVEQHMLRKKYKDPMSPDKDGAFQLLYLSNSAQGGGRLGGAGQQGGAGQSGQFGSAAQPSRAGQPGSIGTALGITPTGAIQGVTSKNTGESLRTFNGKNHYNEWQFIAMQQSTQAGGGAQGGRAGLPGGAQGAGGRGGQRGDARGPMGGFPGAGRQGTGSQPPPQRGPSGSPR
jgi:type II secretory pathway pseudopilin PulG